MLSDWSRHSTVGGVCRLPLELVFACWFVFQNSLRRKKEQSSKSEEEELEVAAAVEEEEVFLAGFYVSVLPKLLLPQEDRLSARQTAGKQTGGEKVFVRGCSETLRICLSQRMSPTCVATLRRTRGSSDGQTKLWHTTKEEEPETEEKKSGSEGSGCLRSWL